MPTTRGSTEGRNAILQALPPDELQAISAAIERVPLVLKEVLQEIGKPLSHLWFPASGVCSVVTEMADGAIVENATIGREGFVGLSVVLGASSTLQRTLVQIPGEADRLRVQDYNRLRDNLPGLERLQRRYALSVLAQIAQGSACNRLHPIEARCARWLLQTHDRVDAYRFSLRQEFLAQMLGVTRPSVTVATGILQQDGLIEYRRDVVSVLDRAGLERSACECYQVITKEFDRLGSPV